MPTTGSGSSTCRRFSLAEGAAQVLEELVLAVVGEDGTGDTELDPPVHPHPAVPADVSAELVTVGRFPKVAWPPRMCRSAWKVWNIPAGQVLGTS